MRFLIQCGIALMSSFSLSLFFSSSSFATVVEQVEKPLQASVKTRQATQKKVEKWKDDRAKLNNRFDSLTEEVAGLEKYRSKLQRNAEAGRKRLVAKQEQLTATEKISEEIAPFLEELLLRLQEVSSDGPPFLTEERAVRLAKMEEMVVDPKVAIGEKYRRLMEALQIEAEYGFTTEVYQQEIAISGGQLLVDIFRLGRLSLFYISLDGLSCGVYNEATGSWEALSEEWLRPISSAVAMARKEQPVNFVDLPLGTIGAQ